MAALLPACRPYLVEWDEGKASGPAEPFDIERTFAAARPRLKELGEA